MVMAAMLLGGLFDSLLVLSGALAFHPPGEFGLPLPLWMWVCGPALAAPYDFQ